MQHVTHCVTTGTTLPRTLLGYLLNTPARPLPLSCSVPITHVSVGPVHYESVTLLWFRDWSCIIYCPGL